MILVVSYHRDRYVIVTIVMTTTVRWRIPNFNYLFVVVHKLILVFVPQKRQMDMQ